MKKTLFLIILIVSLIALYFVVKKPAEAPEFNNVDTEQSEDEIVENKDEPIERQSVGDEAYSILENGKYLVSGTNIAVDIESDIVPFVDNENFIEGSVAFQKDFAVNFKKGDKNYVLVPVAVNNGGTGIFVSLSLFEEVNGSYQNIDEAFLGDRIIVEDLYISNDGVVIVEILDREADESFAAVPTVPVNAKFSISTNGRLILVK